MYRQNQMNFNNTKHIPIYQTNNQPSQNKSQPEQKTIQSSHQIVQPLQQSLQSQPVQQVNQILQNHSLQTSKTDEMLNDNFLDKNELYEFINNKFTKLDDALLSFKQERYPTKLDDNDIQTPIKNSNKSETKNITKRQKKIYENVDDSLFNKAKEKYPNIPDDKKSLISIDNDGNYYINKNKKKIPLNNVNALRLSNNKL